MSAGQDTIVRAVRVRDGSMVWQSEEHGTPVRAVAVAGRRAISGSDCGMIVGLSLEDGSARAPLPTRAAHDGGTRTQG